MSYILTANTFPQGAISYVIKTASSAERSTRNAFVLRCPAFAFMAAPKPQHAFEVWGSQKQGVLCPNLGSFPNADFLIPADLVFFFKKGCSNIALCIHCLALASLALKGGYKSCVKNRGNK